MSQGSVTDNYRSGKLKLKGNKQLFKTDKSKKNKDKSDLKVVDEDRENIFRSITLMRFVTLHICLGKRFVWKLYILINLHTGGWRRISEELDLRGGIDVAIECGDYSKCYLAAKDNGKFTLGAKHFKYGEIPNPEEIFTLIKSPDDPKISLKTGFGKFVGVDTEGTLTATADAIGARERFDIVFQDGKTALQSCNGLFLSLQHNDDGYIYVSSRTARDSEIINIRTNTEKKGPTDWRTNEDKKKAGECETSYIKMYQHSRVETKNKMINYDVHDKRTVRRAQEEGNLHETLLDRRAKLKSDKYC